VATWCCALSRTYNSYLLSCSRDWCRRLIKADHPWRSPLLCWTVLLAGELCRPWMIESTWFWGEYSVGRFCCYLFLGLVWDACICCLFGFCFLLIYIKNHIRFFLDEHCSDYPWHAPFTCKNLSLWLLTGQLPVPLTYHMIQLWCIVLIGWLAA